MSLVCGIFSLDPARPVPDAWRSVMRAQISRERRGAVHEHDAGSAWLAKLDLGAFEGVGWSCSGDAVSTCSGEPLLARSGSRRDDDLRALADAADAPGPLLAASRGSFMWLHWQRRPHRLILATDSVGVRPIYVVEQDGFVAFAGALRLIEALPGLRLSLDVRGSLEEAGFGFALGERTRYAEVRSLRGGVLLVATGGVARSEYWRWDRDACARPAVDLDSGMIELRAAFRDAVAARLRGRRVAMATLSGGLDSRCVATELRSQGAEVHSLNVSWRDSQDEVFGRDYAQAIGTVHHPVTLPDDEVGAAVATRLFEEVGRIRATPALAAEPASVWGGDGGSVGVGYVYLTPQMVATMRTAGAAAAARAFVAHNSIALAQRMFRSRFTAVAAAVPTEGVEHELRRHRCEDPGRALFLFLVENDQRRHLAQFYEDVDRTGIEFVEPFYDREVLAASCRLPLDACLRHVMYHRWLELFPAPAATLPWQSYPGHDPCPVPVGSALMSQFDRPRPALEAARRRQARASARDALEDVAVVQPLMRVPAIVAAYVAFRLGIAEPLYVFKQAHSIAAALRRCEGRIAAVTAAGDA